MKMCSCRFRHQPATNLDLTEPPHSEGWTELTASSFPINVNIEKNNATGQFEVEIRNFIGEKLVRRVVLRPGVDVEASKNVKDQLELSGNVRSPCPSSDPVC